MGEPATQIKIAIPGLNLENSNEHLNGQSNGRPAKNGQLPPMLVSYLDYKARYPDALLLFQVGDFYEVFFEDANTVARTLNLTLTSRDKSSPNPVPMCGVPVSVADGYVDRLVAAGFSVAVVSQDGEPEGGKGMMLRKLERIVTPGIDILGGGSRAARVGALVGTPERGFSLCFTDITSASLMVREQVAVEEIANEATRAQVAEIVLPHVIGQNKIDRRLTWVRLLEHHLGTSNVKLRSLSEVTSQKLTTIDGFTVLSSQAKQATALLVDYINETTPSVQLRFRTVALHNYDNVVSIDAATRRTLELLSNARDGSLSGTLVSVIDKAVTVAGSRLLKNWIVNPLSKLKLIHKRQEAVEYFVEHTEPRVQAQQHLKRASDVERIATRVELNVAHPRELAALRETLEAAACCNGLINQTNLPDELLSCLRELKDNKEVLSLLQVKLHEAPPALLRDGGVIASGVDAELDRLREIKAKGRSLIAELEGREKQASGISTLKVRFNNQIGYYFELTKSQREKVPNHFEARQSTTSGDRFITPELKQLEQDIVSADSKITVREAALYKELLQQLAASADNLRQVGQAIARLDCYLSLAEVASDHQWVKPTLDDNEACKLRIERGKHPVLSVLLREQFVPNSLALGGDSPRLLLVTGPNMGGKSTFLRQAAQIVILAQIGCYVPASAASISIVDAIFARLGASDNISEGESTFMVEMREASLIVSNASKRSLVLIDEIGRGTATADGLALAQAILEWLVVRTECRTLFATHFHELTDLEQQYPQLANCSVSSVESGDDVHFTHEIIAGAASRSYGIEVAQTAGMPRELIARARELLALRVSNAQNIKLTGETKQLSIFQSAVKVEQKKTSEELSSLLRKLTTFDLNNTTPIEGLKALEELKSLAQKVPEAK